MSGLNHRLWTNIVNSYRNNIFNFCKLINFNPTDQQADLLKAIMAETLLPVEKRKKRIAVKSGQGTGKTAGTVVGTHWRILRAYNALGIVTAPSMRQCRDVWIAEAGRIMDKAPKFLRDILDIRKQKIIVDNKDSWGIWTVTASKDTNAQGYHEENLTVVVDEAAGVSKDIIVQFKGTLTGNDNLLIEIGNPNLRNCSFFDSFNANRDQYRCLTFNAEDSPLVSKEQIKLIKEEFGVESDVYMVRILGEFPASDPSSIVSYADIMSCSETDMLRCSMLNDARIISIDPARFGDDESVIVKRMGNTVTDIKWFVKRSTTDVCEAAFGLQARDGWRNDECTYVVDATGMGQAVADYLIKHKKQVYEFHNHSTASNPDLFGNKITEAWFQLAAKAKNRVIYIPQDVKAALQLSNRLYYMDKKGKIIVESKDEYLARGAEESPDRADALVMAFWDQHLVQGRVSTPTPGVQLVRTAAGGAMLIGGAAA